MSILPAVAVIVGAPAVPNFTPVNVAVPFPVLAACLSNRTKDLPAVAVGEGNGECFCRVCGGMIWGLGFKVEGLVFRF